MEPRKIQLVGNRSYSISLPKQWILSNNLKEQDTVFLEQKENGELTVKKSDIKKQATKDISFDIDKISDISEFLVFCYVKDIDHIRITYKKLDPEKISSVQKVLKYLEGYEIVYQDDSRIDISFLFNEIKINIPKLIFRMIYLLKLSISYCISSDKFGIEETEMSIDRFYNLSKRILFSCMKSSALKKENEITHDEDIFFYKDIFKKFEQIGDSISRLSNYKPDKQDIKIVQELVDLVEHVIIKKCTSQYFWNKINSIKINSKNPEIKLILSKMHERCKDFYDNAISIEFNKKYFSE